MKRLVCHLDVGGYSLTQIESPFFALYEVKRALAEPEGLTGLRDLFEACGLSVGQNYTEQDRCKVLEKVESGDWLMVSDDPFSPLSADTFGKYSNLSGRTFSLGSYTLRQLSASDLPLVQGEVLTLERVATDSQKVDGPGKWVLKKIDYDGVRNSLVVFANRLTSFGEEGRMFLGEGKDFMNTSRTLIQEWVPLTEEERHFSHQSSVHRYGELRHISQRFIEGADSWPVSGSAWHWQPVTADVVYEYKKEW
ncbi:hypothetical protein SAMN03159489_00947 [Pseudomonas sp. NFPP07]|uniref:hypothetical protein n=1 Tax=Pseudomonas sp. NFPP07 TaxID=1566213 RepID=UPI0008F0ACF4|nr:hypothetical protein [Pseudomonas sp. NFPP07]SFP35782.1 hypothetical protein SAMN03159489_00947 [Pseudomonas sp. NFPP07]